MQRIHKLEELMSFQKQALKEEGLQLDCSGRPPGAELRRRLQQGCVGRQSERVREN